MREQLLRLLSAPVVLAGLYLFFRAHTWGPERLLGLVLFTAGMILTVSGPGAFFAVTCLLAANACDLSGEPNFLDVMFALYAVLASGCILACVVIKHPSLGKEIEHGQGGI